MFSKDNLKRLAEQAQKAGNRLATNAGGTTNTWFAGQISPEKGDGIEGLSELPPEQAVVKLQRQNARLRRKAEAAMAIEQENANLKTQLHDLATHMATKIADEMADDSSKAGTNSPDKAAQLLEAKVEMLRSNLTTARQELEESAGLKQELARLHAQLKAAGLEPGVHPASRSLSSATELPMSTNAADMALSPDADDQQEPTPGRVSPGHISPFQSIAMQEPGMSWLQSSEQAGEGGAQSEELRSGLQSSEASQLYAASAVTQLQHQNAALKAELAQLTQREAAEEADVTGLQSQNRKLIGEVEKLRQQIVEARHKLADSKVAASLADRQQKELEAQLEQSKAEAANLKSQQAETQHSHEEELQSLRHTMQLVSEHMRTAQKEFDSNLQASAAKLSALKADSEQKTEELARQLGQSDFALRQLRGQLETAMSTSVQKQGGSGQEQQKEQSEEQLEAVTQELGVLKAQHEQSLQRHESSVSEYDDSLKQHSADNAQLQEDMAALQTQLAAAEQQLVQSRDAAENLKEQVQAKETAAGETASRLHELQQEVQSQQSDSQDAEVAAMADKLPSLQTKNSQLEQEAVELKSQLDHSRQQVQEAQDALSEEHSSAQKSRDALTICQLLLAEASSGQKELQSQCADLQLQADEAAAQSSILQSALTASEGKLADSETELAETRSHVEALQQQLESLQQEVVFTRTAQQQMADQLQEVLNDKTMLEGQMEASLSLVGQAGENGSTGHSMQPDDERSKKHLLQQTSFGASQDSQGTSAMGNSDADSPGEDLQALVEDTAPDRPPAEETLLGPQEPDSEPSPRLAAAQRAEAQLDEALKGRAEVESRLAEAMNIKSDYEERLQEALAAKQRLEEQLTDGKSATVHAAQQATAAQAQLTALEQDLQQAKTQTAALSKQLASAQAAQGEAAQQATDAAAGKAELARQLQDALARCTAAEAQLKEEQARREDQQASHAAAGSHTEQQLEVLKEQETHWQQERQAFMAEQEQVKQQLAALQSQEAGWQEERQSLRDRCERLQKTNQQRRSQLLEAQQAAADADKVHSQLAASEATAASLKAELLKAEAQAREAGSLQQAVEQAEQGRRALAQDWQKEQALLEKQLQAAGRNRDQLAEQVAMLSPVAATNEALHAQLSDLRRDLQRAQGTAAQLPQETARADEAEAKCRCLEADAATASGQMSKLEDKLLSTEQRLQEAQGMVSDAKQAHAELARSYQDEMEGLAGKAPSAWPPHVRQLVESRERAAASAAEAAAHAEAETVEAEFEAEAESLRQTAAECRSKQEKAQAQMDAAQSRVAAIGVELEERESSLRQQLQQHQSSAAGQISSLTAEVARVTHELDVTLAQARGETSEWQDRWQQAVKELADVKERAWSLLEEKDLQLQSLKAGRPPSPGGPTPSKTSSHASFSRRTSASGVAPAGPAATPGPTSSEIQPSRSVSEDSDSEGGTLFQPVQFREHVQGPALQQASAEQYPRVAGTQAVGSDPVRAAAASNASKDDVALLRQRMAMLEQELADSEHTHQLRDKAAAVLKEEIAMLYRSDARGSVNVDYVKNVLLNGFESGELSSDSSLVPVLSRLLHFSPVEIQRVKQAKPASLKRTMSRTLTRFTSQ